MSHKSLLISLALSVALGTLVQADPADVRVRVLDKMLDTAGVFLAYTEFELSGEPLAEALGLDLDALDPSQLNQPTVFDYAAGIESYEYSEEAMYAVNYQSQLGPHLVNGPANAARGGTMDSLAKRFGDLADAVGAGALDLPRNFYPISFPYVAGRPEFAGPVDTTTIDTIATTEAEVLTATGDRRSGAIALPAYARDYASLAWNDAAMDKTFAPGAAAAMMLKDVMWAQDFLGGMHTIQGDKEVEATSATMDHNGTYALGVSTEDGLNGVILTEIIQDRLLLLRDRFGFDGTALGTKPATDDDTRSGPIWFAHRVAIDEATANGVKTIGALRVEDESSRLRDAWKMLWSLSEVYAFSDQREVNNARNPAFQAVFDGAPFAAAPAANRDSDSGNDVVADDVFSNASLLVNSTFKTLDALHFNAVTGTFVDHYDGVQGTQVTTYDAAYLLQALSIYQRSQDALAVGYASADAGDSLNTEKGARALVLLRAQADFILANLIADNGLVADSYEIITGPAPNQSLATQFATIHGLTAAFLATRDNRYKAAARALFLAVEAQMYDAAIGTYADVPGQPTQHTPYTAAAISAGLRSAMLTLRSSEADIGADADPRLGLAHLTERYASWFRTVINGRSIDEGMQLAEWLGDTGENLFAGGDQADTDRDGVAQITGAGGPHGTASVMAARVEVSADRRAEN